MPNLENDKIVHSQNLKDQSKIKEALEILSDIENVNDLTVDEQISFYLLQSSLFSSLYQHNKALNAVDQVFQKCIKTGNDLVMLDAYLTRGHALWGLGKNKECYDSILKCEELISRIKDQPEKIIGKRKMLLSRLKGFYYLNIGEFNKVLEYMKRNLALSEKYGTKLEVAKAFNAIGISYDKKGDFKMALENYENSLKISKEINIKIRMAGPYNNIGDIFRNQGDLDRALEYYKQSLFLIEKRVINLAWL